MAGTAGSDEHDNCGNETERMDMADEGSDRTSKKGKLALAKTTAALVALLLLGVMASGALADGNPFSALDAITGSTSTSSDTTGTFTDGTTSTDATTSTDVTTTAPTTTTTAPAPPVPY